MGKKESYIPGEKNLGESGKRKRYLISLVGFSFFIIYFLLVYLKKWPNWTIILSFIPLSIGYIGIIQGKMSFCAMFANQGVCEVNLEDEKKKSVESEKDHEQDIKKANKIYIYTIVLSTISTGLSYLVLNLII